MKTVQVYLIIWTTLVKLVKLVKYFSMETVQVHLIIWTTLVRVHFPHVGVQGF